MELPKWLKALVPRSSEGYRAIPTPVSPEEAHAEEEERVRRQHKLFKFSMIGLLLSGVLVMLFSYASSSAKGCEANGNCTDVSSHLWGQYSPWFAAPSKINPAIPHGCEVTFVNVLSRHGSRYPTSSRTKAYSEVIDRIHNSVTEYGKGYEFLKNYHYELLAESLTEYGEQEMVDSGITFYRRYGKLAKQSEPFIRSDGSSRVVLSAQNFTQGLYRALGQPADKHIANMFIVPEDEIYNNTLNHNNCPYFEEGPAAKVGQRRQFEWRDTFIHRIQARLNKKLPGANLTAEDSIVLMDLCPYHTVDTPDATPSIFCKLFSEEEWRDYDYYETLDKFYGYGPGNPMGPTQGVGYVNELIARMTGQPVRDTTNTNRTVTGDPALFPLDRNVYLDFGHDNGMVTVMAALGLYNETQQLPTRFKISPEQARGFSSAWTVPFGARVYFEKMQCQGDDAARGELVRVLVNERVVPLKTCGADRLGRCRLKDFVASLSFARAGGRWHECRK